MRRTMRRRRHHFFDQFDVFDFAVGHIDGVHLALAAHEDVALEPPIDFDVIGKEADLAQNFLTTKGILGGNVELDVDRIDAEHGGKLAVRRRRVTTKKPDLLHASPALKKLSEFG